MNIPVEGSFLSIGIAHWLELILDLACKGSLLFTISLLLVNLLPGKTAALKCRILTIVFCGLLTLPFWCVSVSSSLFDLNSRTPSPKNTRVFTLELEEPPTTSAIFENETTDAFGAVVKEAGTEPPATPSEANQRRSPIPHGSIIAVMTWFLGFLLFAGRTIRGLFSGWLAARQALPNSNDETRAIMDRVHTTRKQLRVRSAVQVRFHPTEPIPFIWGIRSPRLILPATAHNWKPDQIQAVLYHELAHINRHDLLRLFILDLSCAVSWFNPLVWIAANRVRLEMEKACDEVVLQNGANRATYARQLLLFAQQIGLRSTATAAIPAMAKQSNLEQRLTEILKSPGGSKPIGRALTGLVSALVAVAILPLAVVQIVDQTTTSNSQIEQIINRLTNTESHACANITGQTDATYKKVSAPTPQLHQWISDPQPAADNHEIHQAARVGDLNRLRDLLDQNKNLLNLRSKMQMTPLAIAAWYDHLECVEYLIEAGALLDTKNHNGLTPLFCALDRGRQTLANILIRGGADITIPGFRKRSLLHMAARAGDMRNTKLLIAGGADVNATDSQNQTALVMAVRGNHRRVIDLLLEHGAIGDTANVKRNRGLNPDKLRFSNRGSSVVLWYQKDHLNNR